VHLALWIVQLLLAGVFGGAGVTKLVSSRATLLPKRHWVAWTPMTAVRAIGAAEVAAALGLVLPPLTGIAPVLTVAAAAGLALLMAGALAVNARHTGTTTLVVNVVFLLLALVVVIGRTVVRPF